MSAVHVSTTFKRCRSAIDLTDPTLRKIAEEINLAEKLLLNYQKEVFNNIRKRLCPSKKKALDQMFQLIVKELDYLKKVKESEVVEVTGNFVTFRSNEGQFLITVVPEDELEQHFRPFLNFQNTKPRFAKPVESNDKIAVPSSSAESVYYDACYDFPSELMDSSLESSVTFGKSICAILNYIFASTNWKQD